MSSWDPDSSLSPYRQPVALSLVERTSHWLHSFPEDWPKPSILKPCPHFHLPLNLINCSVEHSMICSEKRFFLTTEGTQVPLCEFCKHPNTSQSTSSHFVFSTLKWRQLKCSEKSRVQLSKRLAAVHLKILWSINTDTHAHTQFRYTNTILSPQSLLTSLCSQAVWVTGILVKCRYWFCRFLLQQADQTFDKSLCGIFYAHFLCGALLSNTNMNLTISLHVTPTFLWHATATFFPIVLKLCHLSKITLRMPVLFFFTVCYIKYLCTLMCLYFVFSWVRISIVMN